MREYEATLLLPAEADESVISSAVERITKAAEGSGGEVTKVDRWGRRRLAYSINHQTEGFYVVVELRADPGAQVEMERILTLADEVIRFKVLLRPQKKASKRGRKAPDGAAAESARAPDEAPPVPADEPVPTSITEGEGPEGPSTEIQETSPTSA